MLCQVGLFIVMTRRPSVLHILACFSHRQSSHAGAAALVQARGIASQAKDVVLETFGEAKTIVKDVSKKGLQGLVSGLFGSGGGGGGAGGNL